MKKLIVCFIVAVFPQALRAEDVQAILQWSQRVELSTPVSGTVRDVNVEVGDRVRRGQLLLALDSASHQARVDESLAEITRLSAEVADSKRELDRIQSLYDRTVVSALERDQARLAMVRSESELDEAQARLRRNRKALEDTAIHAPFDAVVVARQAEPGQSVAAGLQPQMLLTLARSGEMIARMLLSITRLDDLRAGQKVTVKVAGTSYPGKIKTLGLEPVIVKEQPAYPADVLFSTGESLRAGMPATVKLP